MKRLILLFSLLWPTLVPGKDLTVATFNIRYASKGDQGKTSWDQRKPVVVEAIRKLNPDVLGVQEALAGQMDYLVDNLPDYGSVGVGRDDGKRKGEYSAIFFRKERLRVVDGKNASGTTWLSDTPETAGSKSWGNEVVRIYTWVKLVDRETKATIAFCNTHWDHRHQGSREQSARAIGDFAWGGTAFGAPVVVMGDFNAGFENPAIRYLLGEKVPLAGAEKEGPEESKSPLRSAFVAANGKVENRRTFNGFRGDKAGKGMIDHILITPSWRVKKSWIDYYERDGIWPSDHFPVAAVLELDEAR